MQSYDDQKLVDMFTGSMSELLERKKALTESGKANRFVIGELPRIGEEITINNLVFEVTNTNEFGKVILMIKKPE
jgi:Mg2+/Co2+ transporter CorC